MLRTVAYLRQEQPKEGNVREFVISDEAQDRHGTIIKMDGWQLDNFKRNPIVMYAHAANRQPDPDLVIGRGDVSQEGNQLVGRITFDVDGSAELENKLAKKVLHKIDNGFLNATSVGFNPLSWGWGEKDKGEDEDTFYFREQELLEFSVVPVPSNPNALAKEFGDEMARFIHRHSDDMTDDDQEGSVTMTLTDEGLVFLFDSERMDSTVEVDFFPELDLEEKKDTRVQLARARFRHLNLNKL